MKKHSKVLKENMTKTNTFSLELFLIDLKLCHTLDRKEAKMMARTIKRSHSFYFLNKILE